MKTISYDKIDIDVLLDIKTFSNIELIKCLKLTFSKEGINKNYGSIIIIFMTTIFISIIIISNVNLKKYISKIIRLALKIHFNSNPNKKKIVKTYYSSKMIKDLPNNCSQSKQYSQSQSLSNIFDVNSQFFISLLLIVPLT